jgi:lactoylglutathione lyase
VEAALNQIGAITLYTADLAVSKEFYQRAFRLPVAFADADSAVFRFGDTLVSLLAATATEGLAGPAPAAVPDRGPRFRLTVWVDDTDATCADLVARGVRLLAGPADRPPGQRTASFQDPDGYLWEVAQAVPAHGAR